MAPIFRTAPIIIPRRELLQICCIIQDAYSDLCRVAWHSFHFAISPFWFQLGADHLTLEGGWAFWKKNSCTARRAEKKSCILGCNKKNTTYTKIKYHARHLTWKKIPARQKKHPPPSKFKWSAPYRRNARVSIQDKVCNVSYATIVNYSTRLKIATSGVTRVSRKIVAIKLVLLFTLQMLKRHRGWKERKGDFTSFNSLVFFWYE